MRRAAWPTTRRSEGVSPNPRVEFKVVIPARFGASRLPGKPLRELAGWPLVRHVHARASESGAEVVIATDDARIRDACEGFGAVVCMTAAEHEVSRQLTGRHPHGHSPPTEPREPEEPLDARILPGHQLAILWVGFVLAYTFERTRSLWPCVLAHAGYNLIQVEGLALFP